MIVSAPFAGPVSFPLLVYKVLSGEKSSFELRNSCENPQPGEIVLDSITNVAKLNVKGYSIVAGVYVRMYSLIGDKTKRPSKIFTIKQGTLADYNARLYAVIRGINEVINTTADEAVKMAEAGKGIGLVGIEVKLGEIFEDEMKTLGYLVPQCVIYAKINASEVLKAYSEGIKMIREKPEEAAMIISSASKYYSLDIMRKIIGIYSHMLTTSREELEKAIRVYSVVEPKVRDLKIEAK